MDLLSEQLIAGLSKIGLALKHKAWRESGPEGLTPTQAQALALLRARGREGLRVADVARELAVSQPTASDAVAALVEKGLVRKERAAADARSALLALTRSGRKKASAVSAWPDFLAGAARALGRDEQAVFLRALVKMVRELQERGEIPIARMCATCRYFRPNVHRSRERPHHCDFAGAAFGDRGLRLDCGDHEEAEEGAKAAKWAAFNRRAKRPASARGGKGAFDASEDRGPAGPGPRSIVRSSFEGGLR
ncbi:MAG: MarR family winged helix-turn-helix transcriptional regulator [Planctomycetota bacterium]